MTYQNNTKQINLFAERPKAFWIGLRRTGPKSNDFKWDDGSLLNYTNWGKDEPNNGNGNEGCVMFGHPCCGLTVWFDVGCNTNFGPDRIQPGYICQKPTGSYTFRSLFMRRILS